MASHSSAIKIIAKPLALEFWKPAMAAADFYVTIDRSRYQLTRITAQQISKKSTRGTADIEYYDAWINRSLSTRIAFEFKHGWRATIEHLVSAQNFSFNTSKLKSLNFISFSNGDIKPRSASVKVLRVSTKQWSIFEGWITLRVHLLVYNDFKTLALITKKLSVNIAALIKKLLTCDVNGSLLRVNAFLEFEVQKFTPVVRNYHLFFSKNDYARLFEVINEIEIINPKILTPHLDIFNSSPVGYFNSQISINGVYYKRFIFKAHYDARHLQKTITNKLLELPLRAAIQGRPRTVDIKLKHLYKDYNKTYFNIILIKNGISNLLDRNVGVRVQNYNFKTNYVNLEIHFKKAPKTAAPIIKRRMVFEKTLPEFATYQFKEQNFIGLKDKSLLNKHPLFTPQPGDFEIGNSETIKILEVTGTNLSMQAHLVQYKFKLLASDPKSQITFDYDQEIYFASSRLEYLFTNLNPSSLDSSALAKKNDRDYYELAAGYSKRWIPVFQSDLTDKVNFDRRYLETDFQIIRIQFKKESLFSRTIPFRIVVGSATLGAQKVIELNIQLTRKVLVAEFNNLAGNDIKLANEDVLASYPIPILHVSDFYTKAPFEILEMTSRYNEHNSSIEGTFIVCLAHKKRILKNVFYFANAATKRLQMQTQASKWSLFQAISKDDILLKYDENSSDYFINPNVDILALDPAFFGCIRKWNLKSRWRRLVRLNIEISYGAQTKSFTKVIKFKKRIRWKDYQAWKEANYAFE